MRAVGHPLNLSPLLCFPKSLLFEIAKHLDAISLTNFRATHSWLDMVNKKMGYRVELLRPEDKEKFCDEEHYSNHVCDYYLHIVQRQERHFVMLFQASRRYLCNLTELKLVLPYLNAVTNTEASVLLEMLRKSIDTGIMPRMQRIELDLLIEDNLDLEEGEELEMVLLPDFVADLETSCQAHGIGFVCHLLP
jgi:hypothetical protein